MINKKVHLLKNLLITLSLMIFTSSVQAACVDNIVLVHGNTGTPSDWNNTYDLLIADGYDDTQIFRPSWGSAYATNNNHSGSEETPVRNSINAALNTSCTGKIDVIGQTMGVT
jgi:hypothetical protein